MSIKGIREVNQALATYERRAKTAATAAGQLTAATVARQAKTDRSWKDRTNQARNGLTGTSETIGNRTTVALAHRVTYGVFLELANVGRFAVIKRTMDNNRQTFVNNVKSLIKV